MNTKVLHVLLLVALVGMLLGGCENENNSYIYQSTDKTVTIVSANPIPEDMKDGFTFNVSIDLPTNIPVYYVWIYPDVWSSNSGEIPVNADEVGIWYKSSGRLPPSASNIIRGGWICYIHNNETVFAQKGMVSTWTIIVSYKNEAGEFVDVVNENFTYLVQIK